jgi:hypothetical protein
VDIRFDLLIKAAAAEIAEPREFRRDGASLNDFLRNCLSPSDSADLVAAKLVEYFCLDDNGAFNNRVVAIKLVVMFLDEVGTAPVGSARGVALKDLQRILTQHPNLQQIQDWARAHYGF